MDMSTRGNSLINDRNSKSFFFPQKHNANWVVNINPLVGSGINEFAVNKELGSGGGGSRANLLNRKNETLQLHLHLHHDLHTLPKAYL